MQTALATPALLPHASLLSCVSVLLPHTKGFCETKPSGAKRMTAVTQPLASFPYSALYGHRQGRSTSQVMVALLTVVVSVIIESTSFHNTGTDRETVFVGAFLLVKLDLGGVGFAGPVCGPTPLHTLAPEGLACGGRSRGFCSVCPLHLVVSLEAEGFVALGLRDTKNGSIFGFV